MNKVIHYYPHSGGGEGDNIDTEARFLLCLHQISLIVKFNEYEIFLYQTQYKLTPLYSNTYLFLRLLVTFLQVEHSGR